MPGLFNTQNNLKIFLEDTVKENDILKMKVIITNFNISNTYYLSKEQIDKLKSSDMFNVEEITSQTQMDFTSNSNNNNSNSDNIANKFCND